MLLPPALSAAQRKLCCLRWIIYSESCIEQEEWARNKEGRGRPWICKRQEIGFRCDKKCSNARSPPQLYWQYRQSTRLPIFIQKRNVGQPSNLEDFPAVSFIFVFRQNSKPMHMCQLSQLATHNKGEFCWEKESFVFLLFLITYIFAATAVGGSLVGRGTNINHGEREIIGEVENTNQQHKGLSEHKNLKVTHFLHEVKS